MIPRKIQVTKTGRGVELIKLHFGLPFYPVECGDSEPCREIARAPIAVAEDHMMRGVMRYVKRNGFPFMGGRCKDILEAVKLTT